MEIRNPIVIDTDSGYAPSCYLICKVDKNGNWNTHSNEDTILIQNDLDYPSIASLFGFKETDCLADIEPARIIIDNNLGIIVEDPGYFN